MEDSQICMLLKQGKKLGLINEFENSILYFKWADSLNEKQLDNLSKLDFDPIKVFFSKKILINEDLLMLDNYLDVVNSMIKLRRFDGCEHMIKNIVSKNFLESDNITQDLEFIRFAKNLRFALSIINNDIFINSPYHNEDLKMIVEEENFTKAEYLTRLAANIDSINSPYHRLDMEFIRQIDCKKLHPLYICPNYSLINLATNKVSLSDPYHMENMQILAKYESKSKLLYPIMTNEDIINGNYYRSEIDAIINANDLTRELAIYDFITNSTDIIQEEYHSILHKSGFDARDIMILKFSDKGVGNLNPYYLDALELLGKIDNKFVFYFAALLANHHFFSSSYYFSDLELLQTISDKDLFMSLFRLMSSKHSLCSEYHDEDIKFILNSTNDSVRRYLVMCATEKMNLESNTHIFDMEYISKLDIDTLDKNTFKMMCHYLFTYEGINSPQHIECLTRLYNGEIVEKPIDLEMNLDNYQAHMLKKKNNKILSRVRSILKK